MKEPLVTIAIPTYNRPELLARSLTSVANQSYKNLQVLVADNCTQGHEVEEVIAAFQEKFTNLTFIKHPNNIGAFKNFFSLLDRANGKYFMWLADDDEISINYVSSLVELLEKNPDASTAAGHWYELQDEIHGKLIRTSNFTHKSPITRAIQFVWKSDDAFFYGLHRTTVIRNASFPGYWWPNKDNLMNWAYVFLFDMVLAGRILIPEDTSVRFINHNYSEKTYFVNRKSRVVEFRNFVLRRINVYCLYLLKAKIFFGIWISPPLSLVSTLALMREFSVLFVNNLFRKTMSIFSNMVNR